MYQYNILTDYLSNYSYKIRINRTTPDYVTAVRKYDISVHISTESLDKFPISNSNNKNDYARSKMIHEFCGWKSAISDKYFATGRFLCMTSIILFGEFIKTLNRPESFMRCMLRCHKQCAREIFLEFMYMPIIYVRNKCYAVF